MSALIELSDVYKIYNPGENEVRALDGVTLRILKGEFIAIIGHSGSGKSTLMNIMGCLDNPTSGDYLLNGDKVENFSDNRLSAIRNRQIGFIFQNFNLIPSLSAIENVELPLIYRGIRREERRSIAAEALARVGLELRMRHLPCELSGGQQQRVAIARAIATRPPVILADEPTGNLDSKSGSEVIGILRELNDDGRTTHAFKCDERLIKAAKGVCEALPVVENYHVGCIASGDCFVEAQKTKEQILKLGGQCCEMEGAAIGHAAYINGVPFVIIRTISDLADEGAAMSYDEFEKKAAEQSNRVVMGILKSFKG